jgi:hypothetical protein
MNSTRLGSSSSSRNRSLVVTCSVPRIGQLIAVHPVLEGRHQPARTGSGDVTHQGRGIAEPVVR